MRRLKTTVRTLPILIAGISSGSAMAAGFQLWEQNVSGLGNAYAGSAASAEDASTIFFNPAGMTLLSAGHAQVVIGGNAIKPTAKFSNSGSTAAAGSGVVFPVGGDGGDAGDWAFVPNAYVAVPITDRISFGLGLGAPFGLKTEYDSDWRGRFLAVKSDVQTINVNPSIAFKVNDQLSLGAGFSYQHFKAELTSNTNYFALSGGAATVQPEGLTTVKGDDDGWGWNVGAIYQLSPSTRLGLSYRSAIQYHVDGDVRFDNRPAFLAAAIPNGPITLDIKLPDTAIFSVHQKLSDQWEMLGDVSWTGWSSIQSLDIKRTNGALLSSTPEHFRDTWRVALGGNYKYSDSWKFRMGVAYDQTPVRDEFRTPRLPDEDRFWLSFGAQYRLTQAAAIDVGYTHVFFKDPSIRDNGGSTAGKGLLVGDYDSSVDILGVQYTQSF